MKKYYEVSRYDDSITILRSISELESRKLNKVNVLEIDDDKLNKFINININEKSITINNDGKVTLGNETYFGISLKDRNKIEIAKKAHKKLTGIVDVSDLVYYVDFIETNNILNSRGFFITDENKEEKYLEILEKGDEDLIDVLEKFLTVKDKLSHVKSAKIEFDDVIDSLKYADENDEKELEQINLKIT